MIPWFVGQFKKKIKKAANKTILTHYFEDLFDQKFTCIEVQLPFSQMQHLTIRFNSIACISYHELTMNEVYYINIGSYKYTIHSWYINTNAKNV